MSRIDFVGASAPCEKACLHKNGLTQPVIKSPVLGVWLISRGRLRGFLLIGYKGEVMKTLQVAVGGFTLSGESGRHPHVFPSLPLSVWDGERGGTG